MSAMPMEKPPLFGGVPNQVDGLLGNPYLQMGLGILGANRGNYGSFGAAVGQGGMMGLHNLQHYKTQKDMMDMQRKRMEIEQANRAEDRGWRVEDRNLGWEREDKNYSRNRTDTLQDKEADREFQRILGKEQFGRQLTLQEQQFKHAYGMQRNSQGFQASQNALSREQQERLSGANQAPVAVLGADGKPVYVPRNQAIGQQPYSAKQEAADALKVQQQEQGRISAQQVLDQAGMLYNHEGRKAGTGLSSFTSMIPATKAKDFKANLDTFKAQTFVPMVSALKGMGALSDAEGKKLSESVGALDPSMSEEAFAKSLQNVTKTLFEKAKASGFNVSMPEFNGMANTQSNGTVKKYNPKTGRIE